MNFWFDIKYAWRLFARTPGHSLLCVVVVALSVGLAMFTYSLAYAMAFKHLPFSGSDRWRSVQIAANKSGNVRASVDAYTYQEILKRNRTAKHLGAFSTRVAVLSEGQASTSLRTAAISPSLLEAMRVAPQTGRIFNASDSRPGAKPVVVLSFDTWKNYFAADPAIVGKQVRIDTQPMQIVGVMPADFYAFQDSALWLPLQLPTLARPGDSTVFVSPFIVLEKGQTADAVLAEMKAAVADVNKRYPELFSSERRVGLIRAHLMWTHPNLQIVSMVVFIALAVLLLGCMNISMIFLARLLERSRELALRVAVGASRSRLMRQCLLETALVVLFGLLLGYALALLGVDWMQSVDAFGSRIKATGRPANLPVLRPVDAVAAVSVAAVIWLMSTVIPAWRISRQDSAVVLAGNGKGVAAPGSARTASLLVGLQVTVSSLVLVICANLVMAIREEGLKPTGLNSARVTISTYPTELDARYPGSHERLRYWDELTAAIKARVTGAEVAYSTAVPTRPNSVTVAIEDQQGAAKQGTLKLPLNAVSDGYFSMLGIRLRSGRLFDRTDSENSVAVAILDENTAKRFWPGQNPLGKRVQLSPADNGPWLTVVGVVSAVNRPYDRDLGFIYRPLRQAVPKEFHLIARVPSAGSDPRVALRAAAFAVDRDVPLHNLQTLDDYLAAMNLNTTAMVPFFTVVTLITLILAATGLFGLISRSVAQRTQEVGIRRALGGTQWQVAAVFLRQGAIYLAIGVIGVGLGILVANLISFSIPNILTRAVPATSAVLVLMTLVIFTASYLPTRRAVALEPGDALRYE